MSMPQPIYIAIVCSEIETLKYLRRRLPLSSPGIAPKFYLISLNGEANKITPLAELQNLQITSWVALDQDSVEFCRSQSVQANRGFYDDLFPETLIEIKSKPDRKELVKEMKNLVDEVGTAFCRSS